MERLIYLIVDIGDTIYYNENDNIKQDTIIDIHITKNTVYYNTTQFVATFNDNNYGTVWFTDIEEAIDAIQE